MLTFFTLHSSLFTLTSCVETDSSLVEYVDDNKLNTPNDTVYSLIGIINKMQVIADRTVLLGEIRADLAALTDHAELDLQDLANFEVKTENPYNNARDYYAIIQNCNYFIANADTTLEKRGEKIFAKELAAIRTYRAWTYMQLALNYGKVPFFTEPILTEKDAEPSLYPSYDINEIAAYFINELAPYVDAKFPSYGSMNGMNSEQFFIPVRVLLGDLCLWSGRYRDAAKYYHDYLTVLGSPKPIYTNSVEWSDFAFSNLFDSYANSFSASHSSSITNIPMMTEEYDGIISRINDVFCSTEDNNYYYQATRSEAYRQLSASQRYVQVYMDPATQLRDTISAPDDMTYLDETMRGDLRLYSNFSLRSVDSSSDYYSTIRQRMYKYSEQRNTYISIYRLPQIYLRYAEALNRAGIPEAAFAVLKHGICQDNLIKNIGGETVDMLSASTREKAGDLIEFSQYNFSSSNTVGIHSRGCGHADADTTYIIPSLPSLQDSILYVEDKICDEMALELAFEGTRYYDLMRISQHRNDPTFLARKIANRNGAANFNSVLFAKLSDEKNWYLPLE